MMAAWPRKLCQVMVKHEPGDCDAAEGDDVTLSRHRREFVSRSAIWASTTRLNQTPPPTGDQFAESFTYEVDWGDGTVDVITVSQVAPGSPLVVNSQTTVLSSARTSGDEGIMTTGSFEVEH